MTLQRKKHIFALLLLATDAVTVASAETYWYALAYEGIRQEPYENGGTCPPGTSPITTQEECQHADTIAGIRAYSQAYPDPYYADRQSGPEIKCDIEVNGGDGCAYDTWGFEPVYPACFLGGGTWKWVSWSTSSNAGTAPVPQEHVIGICKGAGSMPGPGGPYMTGGYAPSHTDGRGGINSAETIAAPDALTEIPYEDELIDKRGNPDSPYKDEFGNYTKDAADGGACSGKGFLCDFTNSTFGAQQEYTPEMMVWKIVDPQDVLHNTDMYTWQTLNCEVKINTEDSNADQSNHWFYVPTGQENIQDRKGNYCDIEAVYREINDTALSMLDTITVRGESNRLNSTGNAEQLIGEQFDLTCTCETKLETEAATTFQQADLALLTSMKGTAQERTMSVKLELYSDGGLTDQVAADATFPATEPSFFFLARHVYDNDWDVKLQLTTCIACPDSTGCSVLDGPGNAAVMFYETCDVKTGGPQLRGIDGDSWMQPSGFTNWSNADPTNSPYHVLGFQKFRLSSSNSMQVTCMVTGCEAGPNDCPPCGTRARAFFGDSRRLQSFGTSELAIGINFPSSGSNQDETMAEDGTMAGQSSGSDSAAPVSFGLIAMAGVAAAACAYATRSFVKNRAAVAGRSVS